MSVLSRRLFLMALSAASLQTVAGSATAQKPDPSAVDRDVVNVLDLIQKRAKFPIRNFGELASILGGEKATLTLAGQTIKISDLRKHIPQSAFPIASIDELAVVAAKERSRYVPGKATGEKIAVPEGEKPPTAEAPPKPKTPGGGAGVKRK